MGTVGLVTAARTATVIHRARAVAIAVAVAVAAGLMPMSMSAAEAAAAAVDTTVTLVERAVTRDVTDKGKQQTAQQRTHHEKQRQLHFAYIRTILGFIKQKTAAAAVAVTRARARAAKVKVKVRAMWMWVWPVSSIQIQHPA